MKFKPIAKVFQKMNFVPTPYPFVFYKNRKILEIQELFARAMMHECTPGHRDVDTGLSLCEILTV